MKIRKFGLAALAAVAAVTLASCSSQASSGDSGGEQPAADEVIKLRVQSQASIAAEPLFIGMEEGFFEEEGLEIEIVDIPDAATAFSALQSNQLDLAFAPTISVLQASRQNMPLVMVAPSDGLNPDSAGLPVDEARNFTSSGVYVSKVSGITDIAGLAGASIAVPELKSQPDGTITSVLHEAGIETDDIQWQNLGFVPAVAALKDGTLDAAFLVSPYTIEADQAGLKRVMNPSVEFFPPGSATTAWVGTQSWVDGNSEAVARFQRAIAKSAAWANENLTATQEHVIARADLTITPADMPKSYWPTEFKMDDLKTVDQKLVDIGFFDGPADLEKLVAPNAN